MFNVGDIIKHKRAMDVCVLVEAVYSDGWIKGAWINMGFEQSFTLEARDIFQVVDANDWQVCEDVTIGCLRKANWI